MNWKGRFAVGVLTALAMMPASDVCTAPRRLAEGRVVGAVSDDGRSVGDLCFAVREVEITPGRSPSPRLEAKLKAEHRGGVVERTVREGLKGGSEEVSAGEHTPY